MSGCHFQQWLQTGLKAGCCFEFPFDSEKCDLQRCNFAARSYKRDVIFYTIQLAEKNRILPPNALRVLSQMGKYSRLMVFNLQGLFLQHPAQRPKAKFRRKSTD